MIRPRANQRGQALIEFGLVLPFVLMLMVATVDAGRFVLAITALADAVREGARAAVAYYPSDGWDVQAADRARASSAFLDSGALHISVAQADEAGGTFVTVAGDYRWQPITPFAAIALADVPLSSTSRMLAQPAPPIAPPSVQPTSSASPDESVEPIEASPSADADESALDEATPPISADEPSAEDTSPE